MEHVLGAEIEESTPGPGSMCDIEDMRVSTKTRITNSEGEDGGEEIQGGGVVVLSSPDKEEDSYVGGNQFVFIPPPHASRRGLSTLPHLPQQISHLKRSRREAQMDDLHDDDHDDTLNLQPTKRIKTISYIDNKTVKQHSINFLSRDVLSHIESSIESCIERSLPNLISVLDISNQIPEAEAKAEEEEKENLPPNKYREDELENGSYQSEENTPEFNQHSTPPNQLQRTFVYKRLQESPEESERRKTDNIKEIEAEDSYQDLVKKVSPDTEMDVINSEELKFLSVYDSNYMGHGNFALLQLNNDGKVAIPLKIAETGNNQIRSPYFEEDMGDILREVSGIISPLPWVVNKIEQQFPGKIIFK